MKKERHTQVFVSPKSQKSLSLHMMVFIGPTIVSVLIWGKEHSVFAVWNILQNNTNQFNLNGSIPKDPEHPTTGPICLLSVNDLWFHFVLMFSAALLDRSSL